MSLKNNIAELESKIASSEEKIVELEAKLIEIRNESYTNSFEKKIEIFKYNYEEDQKLIDDLNKKYKLLLNSIEYIKNVTCNGMYK